MNDGTDEEGKLILALDVGGTKIAGSVLRFSSGHMPELIRLVQEPTQAQEGGLAVLQRIVEFSCELLGRIDREVMGIGIGAAGVIALDGSIESATSLMRTRWENRIGVRAAMSPPCCWSRLARASVARWCLAVMFCMVPTTLAVT